MSRWSRIGYRTFSFVALSVYCATVLAATMTEDQFERLLENAKFFIGTWQGMLGVLIFSLALFLWNRIVFNEREFREIALRIENEFRLKDDDLARDIRHRAADLNNAVLQASTLLIEQTRIHETRMQSVLDKMEEMKDEVIKLRQQVHDLELRNIVGVQ